MRVKASTAAVFGAAFLLQGNPTWAAAGSNACLMLTRQQITDVLGVAVDAGEHVGPGNALCSWGEPGDPTHEGKHVLLTLYRAVGKISPVERFENGKMPIGGIQKTPLRGIGDDAYYIDTPGFGLGLNVRKGNSAFQIKVFGFPAELTKALEKALAETVLPKL
jgi:hypothetical protein